MQTPSKAFSNEQGVVMESTDVRVARMEEQLKFMITEAGEAKAARKAQYESMDELRGLVTQLAQSIATMNTDVNSVRTKLDGQAPTIEEFITIKHKVVGAGKIGKWLWVAGTAVISYAFASRETLIKWLT